MFYTGSRNSGRILEPVPLSPEEIKQGNATTAMTEMYFQQLFELRRKNPGDDLTTQLVQAEEDGSKLSNEELVANIVLLFGAGHETTVNLIANAILAMLREPRHWAALSADPTRAAAIVEETLRYDPPVQLSSRVATTDMTIGGVTVPAGDIMMVMMAAAQRDPDLYDDPDTFDPDRGAIRHLAFGLGPHFCLGAPLARLEATIALSALTARFPHARLAGEPAYKPNVTLRGMSSLPLTV